MTRIVADITMSLDGFVTGPNAGPGNGLGDGGEPLHRWVFAGDPEDDRILKEGTERSGAVIMGRSLFDVIDAPDGWRDDLGYGAHEVGRPPFFVVTGTAPAEVRLSGLDWTFVTTGLEDAIDPARGGRGGVRGHGPRSRRGADGRGSARRLRRLGRARRHPGAAHLAAHPRRRHAAVRGRGAPRAGAALRRRHSVRDARPLRRALTRSGGRDTPPQQGLSRRAVSTRARSRCVPAAPGA